MFQRVNVFGISLIIIIVVYLSQLVVTDIFDDESVLVDEWLDQNELGDYKKLFRDYVGRAAVVLKDNRPFLIVNWQLGRQFRQVVLEEF
ncbi:hypothetical protein ABMA27_002340 [Loxostege sticticalis]|uniref:Uncharacterized protein n=1 Tax=Loxostege sticticalis TaxID=481309 RepID=A0ABR3HXH4_LOXSC